MESNILTLRQGGNIVGIDLKPLPREFIKNGFHIKNHNKQYD